MAIEPPPRPLSGPRTLSAARRLREAVSPPPRPPDRRLTCPGSVFGTGVDPRSGFDRLPSGVEILWAIHGTYAGFRDQNAACCKEIPRMVA